uniref:Butyrophilin, subfamily 1, member A1 n=1 Tax=Nannospalax galili TaxID=1026970 RepID=A0A8C6W8H0_NANGA
MAVSPNSHLLVGLLSLMVLQLPRLDSARFDVVAPQESVLALVGGDAELPCRLSPNVSAEHLELWWFRQTARPMVLLHRSEQGQEAEPVAEYRGRTALLTAGLREGRAALHIRDVRASDDGAYLCLCRDNASSAQATVHLKVAERWLVQSGGIGGRGLSRWGVQKEISFLQDKYPPKKIKKM